MGSEDNSRAAVADQAADWLMRLDAGKADVDAFEAWRNADPSHAAAFAQCAAIWQTTANLRGTITSRQPRDLTVEPTSAAASGAGRRRFLAGIAASVVAVSGLYVWVNRRAYAETGVGERRTVQLPGGSRVELNTDTRLAWRMDEQLDLWIERGEVAITVAAPFSVGVPRLFRIQTALMSGLLHSGQYNVRVDRNMVGLIAASGDAIISGLDGTRLELQSGQGLQATGGGVRKAALSTAALESATAWQRGVIVFDGMTLATAIGEFNRYLPHHIELAEPGLGAVRLGGRFSTDDPGGFLTALRDGFGIDHRLEGDRIVLFSSAKAS